MDGGNMNYEDVSVTITSPEAAITGKAREVSVNWRSFETLLAPVNDLDNKYQILGKTSGKCHIQSLEFPASTVSDIERIRSAYSLSINISRDGVTLITIDEAFETTESKQSQGILEGKAILIKQLEYDILI